MDGKMTRRKAIKTMGKAAAAAALAGISGNESAAYNNNNDIKAMKVLLINGSPKKSGNTNRLLQEIVSQLSANGIDSEIVHIGTNPIRGCAACNGCQRSGDGHCVFKDDICNSILDKMAGADALIVGSPVHYGIPAGPVISLIQRMSYAGSVFMQGKPAAVVTVCRRGGSSAAFQTLQMPFQMLNMPIVTSQYWNIAFGGGPGEVANDAEGLQTMRTLADNMAYMLKQFASGTAEKPSREPGVFTNFIR